MCKVIQVRQKYITDFSKLPRHCAGFLGEMLAISKIYKEKIIDKKHTKILCKIGHEVGILSYSVYVTYKLGGFYTVINKQNEIFTLEKDEIDLLQQVYVNKNLTYVNKTPLFTYCIEEEEFNLDLL